MSPPQRSPLFTPLRLGTSTLTHRIALAPLTRLRADKNHIPLSSLVAQYYAQRSSAPRGGLLISEANLIAPEHGGAKHMPGMWSEGQISAWREVVEAVHRKGGKMFAQLVALGRVADEGELAVDFDYYYSSSSSLPSCSSPCGYGYGHGQGKGFRVVSSSAIPVTEGGVVPHALTREEVRDTVQKFAQAARNAVEKAGFDGVEIHGANGYLVDQFTQDVCNRRTDEYGGSVENRSRFAVEVAQACVEAVGKERVGLRISPFSSFQGMKVKDPVEQFGHLVRELKGLGLAYLHIVESRVVNNVDCEKQEGIEPFLDIWGRTSPVLVAGGFTPESARHAVEVEYTNNDVVVVFGRHFIANPDLPYRIKHGLPLNKYDRDSFYTPERREGYVDYPFSREYLQQYGRQEK